MHAMATTWGHLNRKALALAVLGLLCGAIAWSKPAHAQQPQQRPDLRPVLLQPTELPAGWSTLEQSGYILDGPQLRAGMVNALHALGIESSSACAAALIPFLNLLTWWSPGVDATIYRHPEPVALLAHVVLAVPPGFGETLIGLTNEAATQAVADVCPDDGTGEITAPGLDVAHSPLGDLLQGAPPAPEPAGDLSFTLRLDFLFGFQSITLVGIVSQHGQIASLLFMLTDPITATESSDLMHQLARRVDARLAILLTGRPAPISAAR
jgi:hypothetical protein